MEFALCKEIDALDSIGTQLDIKQEPENEFHDNSIVESVPSVMTCDSSFESIKSEPMSDEEIIEISHKKKRKIHQTDKPHDKNAFRNGRKEDGKRRRLELTELPCIVNITPSAVHGRPSQENHNVPIDTTHGIPNTSLHSPMPERTCVSNGHVALNKPLGQNSSNNNFVSKVYKMLVDIQSTLKDLKAEVTENSKKIDHLQKFLPAPGSWLSDAKSDFNFPISTEEQLLEFEKRLENKEEATKLVAHLTCKTYSSWREMILICMKYMLSRNVAVLYNLNGVKGTKKKFRDLNICRIFVECVQYVFKETPTSEILKRISLVLAGAGDWQGSRRKRN